MKKILLMALLATSTMINAAATGITVSAAGEPVSATEDAAPATAHRRMILVFKEQELDRTTTAASFRYKIFFAGKSTIFSIPEKEEFRLQEAVYTILHSITGLSEQDKAFVHTALDAASNHELYESEYTSLVEQLTKEDADEAIKTATSTLEDNCSFEDFVNARLAKYFDFKMFKGKLKIRFTEDSHCSVDASGTACRGYTVSLDGKSARARVYGESGRAIHPTLLGAVVAIILSPNFSDEEKAPVKEAFNTAKANAPTQDAVYIKNELFKYINFIDDSAKVATAAEPALP